MSVEEIKKYKNLLESILTEAPNYPDMFNDLRKAIGDSPELHMRTVDKIINTTIQKCKEKLRKSDRIVWFLRQWKLGFVAKLSENLTNPQDKADQLELDHPLTVAVQQVLDKGLDDLKKRGGTSIPARDYIGVYTRADDVLSKFEHFFSLPIPAIQNYTLKFQPLDEVFIQFRDWEDEWKKQTRELIAYDPDDGEVVLKFPDGFFWQNLDREYCKAEGNAMGHCGNAAGYRQGDKVLSLRKIVKVGKDDFVRPSLTFILHSDGYLGEMKGRANNKPDEKYHPYILALLKQSFVKGIRGGGYAPENNFQLSDLEDSVREQLINEKPALGTLKDYYAKHGLNQHVIDAIQNEFNDMKITEDGQYAIAETISSISELVEVYGNDTAKYVIEYLDGDAYYESNSDTNYAVEYFLNDLTSEVIKKIGNYILENHEDIVTEWEEENEEDFDPASERDILSIVQYNNRGDLDTLWDALATAARYSEEAGTVDEMAKALKSAVMNYQHEGTDGLSINLVFINNDGNFAYDTPIQLQLRLKDVIDVLSEPQRLSEIEYAGWFDGFKISVEEPRYGFSGTDLESGLEYLYGEYPQFQPTKKDKS